MGHNNARRSASVLQMPFLTSESADEKSAIPRTLRACARKPLWVNCRNSSDAWCGGITHLHAFGHALLCGAGVRPIFQHEHLSSHPRLARILARDGRRVETAQDNLRNTKPLV